MNQSNLQDVIRIELPKFPDPRGSLSVLEQGIHIPFDIKRTYLLYDVPGGVERKGHAYYRSQEFIVALSGSFDVEVYDGISRKRFQLNRSHYGIYVPAGIWRQLDNFSTNSLAMVLASTPYDAEDYMYELKEYSAYRKNIRIL